MIDTIRRTVLTFGTLYVYGCVAYGSGVIYFTFFA